MIIALTVDSSIFYLTMFPFLKMLTSPTPFSFVNSREPF